MIYPEAERNRLLRRVDWRFLLADPQPQRVICFVDGSMAEALRLVGDVVVVSPRPRDLGGPGDIDGYYRNSMLYCVAQPST